MSDSKPTEEFLDAKLVVTPSLVHNDEHTSYITLRDYPTMVTKLEDLLAKRVEEAKSKQFKGLTIPYIETRDGDKLVSLGWVLNTLNNQTKEDKTS